ncbi:subtilisin-like protein [Microthyrium microscopicum]|uniref:tripeptidyl-peptidase II n=1 Tax=Microthyrium microscopicum TaxID=703497 RepID=A0A6A6U956_9PEZI|nr:subtilisin-like protein [Microthyrium microscopicum]
MYLFSCLFLFILSASSLAAPSHHFIRHEKRESIPQKLIKRGNAPRDIRLPVRISLKQQNLHLGHDHLMDISDPKSPNFGKHWTTKEVEDFFAVPQESVESVLAWLKSSGVSQTRYRVSRGGGSIQLHATVSEAEELLKTKYYTYEHVDTGDLSYSCDEYSLHNSIAQHVDFVTPTTGFAFSSNKGKLRKRKQSEWSKPQIKPYTGSLLVLDELGSCDLALTPACIKALYNIPNATLAQDTNELGIFEEGDRYDQADLDSFFTHFASNIPTGTHPILNSIDGGKAPVEMNDAGDESILDFQLAFPIVYPQKIKLFQTNDDFVAQNRTLELGSFDTFLDAVDGSFCTYGGGDNRTLDAQYPYKEPDDSGYDWFNMCGTYKPTNVISLSYGIAERVYSPFYTQRQCHEYLKLGLQGISIFFSSGDFGVAASCGIVGCLDFLPNYTPGFPASCPYVTAVGATQISKGARVTDPEVAAAELGYSSGGGFSNVFARPSYQDDAVLSYFGENTPSIRPPATLYNATGRGFPDVSANGLNVMTIYKGKPYLNGGTSASAPIVASIVNLINEHRIKASKRPIGFLNPIIYQHPEVFNDITSGYNLEWPLKPAFYTAKGWDPVTGLGTPNFPKLYELLMGLP